MLLSIVFILRPKEDFVLPLTVGNAVHACFLHLIRGVDPDLAHELHSPSKDKPFTASPLQGQFELTEGGLLLRKAEDYWFRFTSLEEKLTHVLLGFEEGSVGSLELFEKEFRVVRIARDREEHPWAGRATYDDIYKRWASSKELSRKVRMRFFSPTTFRSKGKNLAFPLPKLVFRSLLDKWNRYAYTHPSSEIEEIIERVTTLSQYELKTRIMDFGRYKQVGFIGECEFLMNKEVNGATVRWLHLLADFAFFSGVGHKTTMGMGQVRRIS